MNKKLNKILTLFLILSIGFIGNMANAGWDFGALWKIEDNATVPVYDYPVVIPDLELSGDLDVPGTLRTQYLEVSGNVVDGTIKAGTSTNAFDTRLIFENDFGQSSWIYKQTDGSLRYSSDSTTDVVTIGDGGMVGVGTDSPSFTLDVLPGADDGLILGGDVLAKSRTDATRKFSRLFAPHYTNAEEPVSIVITDSDGVNNLISIGGGTASGNAATDVRIITASNATTIAGSEVARWNEAGDMGLGITGPVSRLHIYDDSTDTGALTGLTVEQDGTGNAILQYLLTGAQRWTMGVDNADDDKYKIGRGDTWIQGEDLVIDTSGNVGIGEATPTSKLHIDGGIGTIATGIAFGDGDSGMYEIIDDIFYFATGGSPKFSLGGRFESLTTGGGSLKSSASTVGQPSISYKGDLDTGIHRISNDNMSLVTAGVSALTIDSTQEMTLTDSCFKMTSPDASISECCIDNSDNFVCTGL